MKTIGKFIFTLFLFVQFSAHAQGGTALWGCGSAPFDEHFSSAQTFLNEKFTGLILIRESAAEKGACINGNKMSSEFIVRNMSDVSLGTLTVDGNTGKISLNFAPSFGSFKNKLDFFTYHYALTISFLMILGVLDFFYHKRKKAVQLKST